VKWTMFMMKVESNKEVLLYNTYNRAVVILDKLEYNNINDLIHGKKVKEVQSNKSEVKSQIEKLREMKFIMEDETNEKEEYLKELKEFYENDDFLALLVLPTTACNFDCTYCYQKGIPLHVVNRNIIASIMSRIEELLEDNKEIKMTKIDFFGGEPLLNWNFIEDFTKEFSSLMRKRTIDYFLKLTTNGYLLDLNKINFLLKYNLQQIQITMDGLPEVHDKRRMLKGTHKGTFDRIFNNLKGLLDLKDARDLLILLRINFDYQNVDHIPDFLDFIKRELGVDNIEISFGQVTSPINFNYEYMIPFDEVPEHYIKLYKVRLGFTLSDTFTFGSLCFAKRKFSYVVAPNGDIYKCVSSVGVDRMKEGNIYKNPLYKIRDYLFVDLYDECFKEKCPFIPICHTGCRFVSFIRYGDIKKRDCHREEMKRINSEILKIQYLDGY